MRVQCQSVVFNTIMGKKDMVLFKMTKTIMKKTYIHMKRDITK